MPDSETLKYHFYDEDDNPFYIEKYKDMIYDRIVQHRSYSPVRIRRILYNKMWNDEHHINVIDASKLLTKIHHALKKEGLIKFSFKKRRYFSKLYFL